MKDVNALDSGFYYEVTSSGRKGYDISGIQ